MPVTINGNNTPTAGGVVYGDGTNYASTSAGSAGGVLYSAGSSAPAFTAAGTSGQFLQSNGASAPSWAAAPTGVTPTTGSAPYYGARAWATFTNTPTVLASGNVSSVTKSSNQYYVNFTTELPDNNVAVVVNGNAAGTQNIYTLNYTSTVVDVIDGIGTTTRFSVVVFR